MKLLANDQTLQHDASLLCLSSCPVQYVLLPFLLSGVSAGHLTVALTAGLQDNKHKWVQKLKVEKQPEEELLSARVPEPPGGTWWGVGRDAAVLWLEPLKKKKKKKKVNSEC